MQLDLSDSVSIQNFALDVISQFPKVDCLICNAGVLVPDSPNDIYTEDGFNGEESNKEEGNMETATWYDENDECGIQGVHPEA